MFNIRRHADKCENRERKKNTEQKKKRMKVRESGKKVAESLKTKIKAGMKETAGENKKKMKKRNTKQTMRLCEAWEQQSDREVNRVRYFSENDFSDGKDISEMFSNVST